MAQDDIINRRQMWIDNEIDAELKHWYEAYHYLIDSNPAWLGGIVAKDLRRTRSKTTATATALPHHRRQTMQKAA